MRVFLVLVSLMIFSLPSQAAVVLLYHHVSDKTPFSTTISPAKFDEHMSYLKDNGYQVAGLQDVINKLKMGEKVDDKTVVITFDDGYTNILENAAPILKRYDYPYTVFVNTAPIEKKIRAYMTWEQLKQLQSMGASILNHAHEHDSFLPREDESEEAWKKRITDSVEVAQALLKQHLGVDDKILAYPYGEFNQNTLNLIKDLGYLAFGQHSGSLDVANLGAKMPRFPAAGHYAKLTTLKTKLASLPLAVKTNSPFWFPRQDRLNLNMQIQVSDFYASMLSCFYDGERFKPTRVESGYQFELALKKASIRERVNCTAPSIKHKGKRHYWWSYPMFYRK